MKASTAADDVERLHVGPHAPPPTLPLASRYVKYNIAFANGIGTFSQGAHAFGLRRARYRGLAKTSLQTVATAAALNLHRLGAGLAKCPLAPTRISRFAALAA